jgi:hypothetical protein
MQPYILTLYVLGALMIVNCILVLLEVHRYNKQKIQSKGDNNMCKLNLVLDETKATKLQTVLEDKIHRSKINKNVSGIEVDKDLIEILEAIVTMRGGK